MPAMTTTKDFDCGYRNISDRMVILRCCGPDEFFLERVIFPFELLSFQCPPESEVEIWTHGQGGPELLEAIRVEDLLIDEPVATVEPFGFTGINSWIEAG